MPRMIVSAGCVMGGSRWRAGRELEGFLILRGAESSIDVAMDILRADA
jgi:hypothetical protein